MQERHGALGSLAEEFYRFLYLGNRSSAHYVRVPVTGKEVSAGDFFWAFKLGGNDKYLVRPDYLPMAPEIKAVITTNNRQVKVETSAIDTELLSRAIDFDGIDAEVRGKCVYSSSEKVVSTRTQNIGTWQNPNVRTVLTIESRYETPQIHTAFDVLDSVYDHNCFVKSVQSGNEQNEFTRVDVRQIPDQKQIQELRQLLAREQKPVLALKGTIVITPRMIERSRVLRMSGSELERYIADAKAGGILEE